MAERNLCILHVNKYLCTSHSALIFHILFKEENLKIASVEEQNIFFEIAEYNFAWNMYKE